MKTKFITGLFASFIAIGLFSSSDAMVKRCWNKPGTGQLECLWDPF